MCSCAPLVEVIVVEGHGNVAEGRGGAGEDIGEGGDDEVEEEDVLALDESPGTDD